MQRGRKTDKRPAVRFWQSVEQAKTSRSSPAGFAREIQSCLSRILVHENKSRTDKGLGNGESSKTFHPWYTRVVWKAGLAKQLRKF